MLVVVALVVGLLLSTINQGEKTEHTIRIDILWQLGHLRVMSVE